MAAVAGLKPTQLQRVRGRLEAFAAEMFDSMPRKDQRGWGEVYLRGLMMDGKRKSIEPMAARLEDGDEQCLQQFVNQSPWDPVPVRRALARRMGRELTPEAWVIDDTGFPKFGKMSVGVARQYSGALGKVGNCQLGVSINAGGQSRLRARWIGGCSYLRSGTRTASSTRSGARRPDCRRMRTTSRNGGWRFGMIDELSRLGDRAAGGSSVMVRTAISPSFAVSLRSASCSMCWTSRVARPPTARKCSPSARSGKGPGGHPSRAIREAPSSLKELALAAGKQAAQTVTWREGTRGSMTSRFLALKVRPATSTCATTPTETARNSR